MLLFRKPEPKTIRDFLDSQAKLELSYAAVGATGTNPPSGFIVDHTRAELGQGEQVFEKARSALNTWQHLQLGWLSAWPAEASVREGEVIAIVAQSLSLWWLVTPTGLEEPAKTRGILTPNRQTTHRTTQRLPNSG